MNEQIFHSDFHKIVEGIWDIFSVFNGNPDLSTVTSNYGIRFGMGMFFSLFLCYIIKMRALVTMKKHHIVAMIGALLIFIRYFIMFGFEWGYQINLYTDPLIHFLYPPLEHFFYMLGIICIAYYSLWHYEYYPGLLKRIIYIIPICITTFFVYATIKWKIYFMSHIDVITKYRECSVDWQSHLMIAVIALYIIGVSILKHTKFNQYITLFWVITFIEHLTKTVCFYNNFEPSWLATIFHATQIWCIPLLTLHFVKAYVVKLGYCELCRRHVSIPKI